MNFNFPASKITELELNGFVRQLHWSGLSLTYFSCLINKNSQTSASQSITDSQNHSLEIYHRKESNVDQRVHSLKEVASHVANTTKSHMSAS